MLRADFHTERMSASTIDPVCSDEKLAAQAAARDAAGRPSDGARQAFSQLYDRHAPSLFAFLAARVRRSQVDDVHQVIWQRLWEILLRQPFEGHFRGWLFKIARNYLIDLSRKHVTEPLAEGADVTVYRNIYDLQGELVTEDYVYTHYLPWQAVYEVAPSDSRLLNQGS